MNPSETILSGSEAHINLHGEHDFADELIAIPSDLSSQKTASKSSQNLRNQKSRIVLYLQLDS